MGDSSFVILATPAPKKKVPGNADEAEEDTTPDKDNPTKIEPSETTLTPRNNAPPETTNSEGAGAEDERYQPTPGPKIPSFRNPPRKRAEWRCRSGANPSRTTPGPDKTEDEAAPQTKNPLRIYTHPTQQPR